MNTKQYEREMNTLINHYKEKVLLIEQNVKVMLLDFHKDMKQLEDKYRESQSD